MRKKNIKKSSSASLDRARKEQDRQSKEIVSFAAKIPIEKEMQDSYLNYAMSVIVSRALPDVRDGLKPVQRRILYAMWRMGLRPNAKYRKSAAVVGETLAKFHPHGDIAVYNSLARMVQDFSLRYPLIDGQGNWGSIDGDPPSAMRYSEVKLSKIAEELLVDIEKEVVAFSPNYDGTLNEPQVMPAKLPNLLVNGCMGIAVGMATNIPPHNLKEVASAIIALIDHPQADLDTLLEFLPGPDFPTGAIIFDKNQIKQVYALGRGPIVMRARTRIDADQGADQNADKRGSRHHGRIVVTELPYQVNKSDLLRSIADLVREKRLEDIKAIRDESNKEGIRVVIELKKGCAPQKVLNQLFRQTNLELKFYVNLVALVDGVEPRLLNLKTILQEYIKHRQLVIKNRTEFDIARAKQRLHILEGLRIALAHINEIIKLIKRSQDKEEARRGLMDRFKLTEIQAQAILEMKLHELSRLEQNKIEEEFKDRARQKKALEDILAEPKKILFLIKEELKDLIEKYPSIRKTQIVGMAITGFKEEDVIPDYPVLVAMTRDGYIKRLSPDSFHLQARGGKGVVGFETKEEDVVGLLLLTTNHTDLFLFTDSGRSFQLKTYQLPEVSRISRGQSLANFLPIKTNEKVTTLLARPIKIDKDFFVIITAKGILKKIKTEIISKVRQTGLVAIKLEKENKVIGVCHLNHGDEIILVTTHGQSLRFKEKDLRPMGRTARGVCGIKLKKGDEIVGAGIIEKLKTPFPSGRVKDQKSNPVREKFSNGAKLLIVTENGFGKLSDLNYYRLQRRGGLGIKTARVNEKTGKVKAAIVFDKSHSPEYLKGDVLIITINGQVIRFALDSVPVLSRSTQGVRLIRFKDAGDKVASVTIV